MGKRKRKQKSGIQEVIAATPEAVLPTPEFMARNALEQVKTDQGNRTLRVQDKRPIDKYYRMYCIDLDRGIGEHYRRGINEEQFRAADHIASNYERTFPKTAMSINPVRVEGSINPALYPSESMVHAMHFHARIMLELSGVSRTIVEDICCKEGKLSEFEQRRGWREGYGMARLREALDELIEAFRVFGKANSGVR